MSEEKNKLLDMEDCDGKLTELLKLIKEKNIDEKTNEIINRIITDFIYHMLLEQKELINELTRNSMELMSIRYNMINNVKNQMNTLIVQSIDSIKESNDIYFKYVNALKDNICEAILGIDIVTQPTVY